MWTVYPNTQGFSYIPVYVAVDMMKFSHSSNSRNQLNCLCMCACDVMHCSHSHPMTIPTFPHYYVEVLRGSSVHKTVGFNLHRALDIHRMETWERKIKPENHIHHYLLSTTERKKNKNADCWLLTLGIITSYTLFSDLSQHRNHLQSCPPTTNALHITFVYIHTFMAFLHGEHSFWSIHSEYSNNNEHLWKIENM